MVVSGGEGSGCEVMTSTKWHQWLKNVHLPVHLDCDLSGKVMPKQILETSAHRSMIRIYFQSSLAVGMNSAMLFAPLLLLKANVLLYECSVEAAILFLSL